MTISLIIPVKDESDCLDQLFALIDNYPQNIKIYFCNGGCTDDSFEKINKFIENKKFAFTCEDNANQKSILTTILAPIESINDEYVLIHPVDIDCSNFIFEIFNYSQSDYYVFYKKYIPERKLLKLQEFLLNRIRLGLLKDFVWTNGLLIKTKVLKGSSRLRNDFLEDVILSDHLKKNYQGTVIPSYVKCSARRYISNGITLRLSLNLIIMILFRTFKVRPRVLKSLYYKLK